jgi:hypothetical protein
LAVSGTIRLVKAIIMPFLKPIKLPPIILSVTSASFRLINTKLSQPSWWENLGLRWKKKTSILIEDRTRSSTLSLTSRQRCGRDKEKTPLSTSSAEFAVGSLVSLPIPWESNAMTKKKSLSAERKSS